MQTEIMLTFTEYRTPGRTKRRPRAHRLRATCARSVLLVGLASMIVLSACGGGSSSSTPVFPPTLSGNWQFTMGEQLNSDPTKPSFTGGLLGGFLLQAGATGSVTGQTTYSISTLPPTGSGASPTECNSGIDQVTGTLTGQAVSLTASSTGAQTFTLSGTLSFDGTTIVGTYTSTDGAGCGIAATQNWSAALVPPLTGSMQGVFHSTGGPAGLGEQEFAVMGQITEALNNGASSSNLTGTLYSDSPCVGQATLTGQISGNSVVLQIVGADGTTIGQIGQNGPPTTSGPQAVTFISTQGGYVLQSTGIGYAVYATACGGGSLQAPADSGGVCVALNSTSTCQLPITLTPALLTFPAQGVGSKATSQIITVTNASSALLGGLTASLTNNSAMNNFTEADNCGLGGVATNGQIFALASQQSCVITIGFSPQEACAAGSSAQCLSAVLTVTSPTNDAIFTAPISGAVTGSALSNREGTARAVAD